MKKALAVPVCAIALAISGFAADPSPKTAAFDSDLFRREEQVFSVHGEFLYWQVQEGALDYALSMQQSGYDPTLCYAQGKFENATFHGDPGFRIGASFYRALKYWEIKAQYTRLTASGSNSAGKPEASTEYLTGTWPQIFTNPMAHAESHIHLNYNTADIWVDRVFIPNPHLRLRLIGGITTAWMDQQWKIKYLDAARNETSISNRWSFSGGGLKMGTLLDWYWFEDIYVVGGITFSGLLGTYNNHALQETNFAFSSSSNTSLPVRDTSFKDVRPIFGGQFLLGPAYEKNFRHNRIEIFVGYELNAWLNLQEVYRSTSGTPSAAKETWINTGMIALQGLTTRMTVDF